MQEKKKDNGIVLVKCMAIFLVILGHSLQTVSGQSMHYTAAVESSLLNHLYENIYVFHMPLFFSVSGFLLALSFNKTSFSFRLAWLRKRAKRLLLPLITISLLYVFPIRLVTAYYICTDILENLRNLVLTKELLKNNF